IASMLKSLVLQSGGLRDEPADLLTFLNSFLFDQTGVHYITAFYGIYNLKDNSLKYCNAGHCSPYVITGNGIYQLEHNRALPLAIMNNDLLEKSNKQYSNIEIVMEKNSKLLIYTDGLTEATKLDDADREDYFEYTLFPEICRRAFQYPCHRFLDEIFRGLINFRGSHKFEDDICMICIDV
ncbi:PP2C family protein-serine/threonine phosphatase, partial [Spirochaetota bacterium]